ncbi:MAG: Abi family protein [Catenibacterium mitsuokai]|nr:Abi family protein [Catenibacterium mitsuokai]MDD6595615.1 Abi family protein [Catenibacterium mitsuokai]
MKSKYSIDEQLKNLEDKNVQFNIMSKEEAREYLQNNTYYFKLKSYEKSFEYNVSKNQYINLEFAYLVELSKLDMYLRELIIRISLHTEHFLKVKLIDDLTKNEKEDGYHVVRELFSKYPFVVDHINQKKYNSACADLIHKYENNWAAWNLIEVLSFGDFIKLYELYYLLYPEQVNEVASDLIWPLKFIRNASAHNNCLLNTLRKPYVYTHLYDKKRRTIIVNKRLVSLLSSVPTITKNNRKKKITNPVIHDFMASLFLFDEICTSQVFKMKIFTEVKEFVDGRLIENKEFFNFDNVFTTIYDFIRNVVDYLYEKNV